LLKISIKHGSKTFQDLYHDTSTFFLSCQCFTKLLLTIFFIKEKPYFEPFLRVRTPTAPIILFSSTLFITDLHSVILLMLQTLKHTTDHFHLSQLFTAENMGQQWVHKDCAVCWRNKAPLLIKLCFGQMQNKTQQNHKMIVFQFIQDKNTN